VTDWLKILILNQDFLPHLPSLDIHEGAIGEMIRIYKVLSHTKCL
jgi:5'-3' exonuclease